MLGHGPLISIVCLALLFVSIAATAMYYQRGKAFRMISTDTQLEFTSAANTKVEVLYADITRIERTKENALLVYANPNPDKPVIAISDTITDREYLESVLSHFVPITSGGKLPLKLRSWYVALVAFGFLTLIILHVLSHWTTVVLSTGVICVVFLTWSVISYFKFKDQIKSRLGIVLLILLTVVALLRMALYLLPTLLNQL